MMVVMNQFIKESCGEYLKKQDASLNTLYERNRVKLEPIWNMSTPTGYTSHGKDHIDMVVQYVGRLLGENRINCLTKDELFILLMGAICHDVGMIEYRPEGMVYIPDRENHNVNSFSLVYNPSKNTTGMLGVDVPSDDPKYYQSIALLCLGHRDHKENGEKICNLLKECHVDGKPITIPETISLPNNSKVHVRYLAAILRLADEIDVTYQRSPKDVELLLNNFITEETKKHWFTHRLIGSVNITHGQGTSSILLVPNKEEISAILEDRTNPIQRKQLLRLIFSRRKKIEDEISIVNKITRDSSLIGSGLEVEYHVGIAFDNDTVTEADFEAYQEDVEKQQKEERHISIQDAVDYSDSELIKESRGKTHLELFSEEVTRLKRDCNLLETGSFAFSFEKGKSEYTQYFINTQLLLTNRNTLDIITEILKKNYAEKNIDCVIGIGKAGIIMAPNLSLKLKCNSSYLICDWEDFSSVKWEKGISVIDTSRNIIVLLDVISTGTVTKQAIEKIKEKNKTNLGKIYVGAVFCTNNTIRDELEKIDMVKDVFVINDDFQFRTYKQEEYDKDEDFRKEFELLPLRKK